jgi:hypothetical protein
MSKLVKEEQWIWILVNDQGEKDEFLGRNDEKNNISFIPAFLEKEDALKCYNLLVTEKEKKYDVQAILYEDITYHCGENGFMLFILDETGDIKEKIVCPPLKIQV